MSVVEEKDYDVVVGGFAQIEKGKSYIHKVDSNIWSMISYSHACCKMYRCEFIIENDMDFGEFRTAEDIYFSLMLVLKGAKHKFIDYQGYYYCINDSSTTKSMNSNSNFEKIVSDIFAKLIYENPALNKKKKEYLEYAYVAGMINALLVYNRGCNFDTMMNKYDFFKCDLRKKFVNYESNKELYRWHFNGPSLKCRLGVWLTMNSMRLHVDKVIYGMFAFFNAMSII